MAVQTKLDYLTNRDLFSNYYLENLLPKSDTWKSVDEDEIKNIFENIKEIYDEHKDYVETYQEDYLQNRFIDPLFEELGFEYGTEESVKERQRTPDYGMFENDEALKKAYQRKEEEDFYKNALTIAEAKRWGRDLDKRGGIRDFTNPSHQVYVYLQETPVDWAILTNGREWRLYYSKTSHKLDSYYEIDLPTIMEEGDLESFKYFYLLFRSEAFVKDKREECFLDKVYDQSNLFSQELGEDLTENIYEAIRLLAEGFLEFPDNDLDAEDDLGLIHDSSLIYLYRMIFVLYAESEGRDLLDTGNRIYNEDYSLNRLKQNVCSELEKADPKYKKWQSNLWDRLEKLFLLIDKGSKNRGIPEDELYIPAYNGGLFRTEIDDETSDENEFLQRNKVGDSYLAEVIDLLTRHENQNGDGRVFVDYSSLDIRHLGSIYEGLLEYNLNVASEDMVAVKEDKEEKWYPKESYEGDGTVVEELEEGEVYLTTDKGERKATGSYYTPEYIVQYIVENTLDPILDEIREDLLKKGMGNFANEFAERVFELKVLDPAMGSGHFLTNAVDHLAREIVNAHEKQAEELGAETVDETHDIHWARRQVAQKCIYGVDLNDMAVELAKVSLWLRTLAAQQPLAFLDHHLKTGNSLIGSDIEEIEELDTGKKEETEVNSATLDDFGMTKKGTMEDLMRIYQDFIKIENQDLSDIKEMEEKYHEFEHEPIKERLEAMANVHTAREFDVDVPDSAFARMAKAIDDEGKWKKIEGKDWFEEAQELAGDKDFFHWKLAFPEAFYEEDGARKEDAGFDVVIGNPPYGKDVTSTYITFLENKYSVTEGDYDSYKFFLERGLLTLSEESFLGYIIPNTFLTNTFFRKTREFILSNSAIKDVVDFSNTDVFPEVTINTLTIILKNTNDSKTPISVKRHYPEEGKIKDIHNIPQSSPRLKTDKIDLFTPKVNKYIVNKMNKCKRSLEELTEFRTGLVTGDDEKFINKEKKGSNPKKLLFERDTSRYYLNWSGNWINYDVKGIKEYSDAGRPREKWIFEADEKILVQWLTYDMERRINATLDRGQHYVQKNLVILLPKERSIELSTLLGIINSRLMDWYYRQNFQDRAVKQTHLKSLPIPSKALLNRVIEEKITEENITKNIDLDTNSLTYKLVLSNLSENMLNLNKKYNRINSNIQDYLGNYSEGEKLDENYTPVSNLADTILTDTQQNKDKLRLGSVDFEQEDDTLILKASARYKPENPEEHETDRWGYTETEMIPAMKFTGAEKELALIREFTKLAVDEAGGFANFRESATKTMSILDRLEKLTLPKLSDVESRLEKYLEQKEKAERLEEEIRETDHTIDAIVFDLYDLTEEEVETVLDSLDTDEEEKVDIVGKVRDI